MLESYRSAGPGPSSPNALAMRKMWLLLVVLMALPAVAWSDPSFKKVMIVILENTDYEDAVKQPFMARLIKEGVLLSNYHAIGHPSEPNYIAMTSGSPNGVTDDKNYDLDV